MNNIMIVGLGPGDPRLLTREAWEILTQASEVYLRTERHPTVDALRDVPGLRLVSFDEVYEQADAFADVYQTISAHILDLATRPQGVVYAVPGHPAVGETTTQLIQQGAAARGLTVRIVEGLSFIEPLLTALRVDALDGLQIADAMVVASKHHAPLDPDRPAILGQLYSRLLAGEVKLVLLNTYPEDHPLTLVQAAGTPASQLVQLPLHELDHAGSSFDHLTALYIPPLPHAGGYDALQEIVAHLRAPNGCPWDREQTHETLVTSLLEETYEVVAAIESGDAHRLSEELGDLYLNLAMQVQIAAEEGEFRLADVLSHVIAKLIRRHPHVFSGLDVQNVDEVLQNWEKIKAAERQTQGQVESALGSVPTALPALMQAEIYQRRAARIGWAGAPLPGADAAPADETSFGDLLFAMVAQARAQGVDPERALRQANERFASQVRAVEARAQAAGVMLSALPAAERAIWWE
jgi:tetrapyrrole methylase family protein/MazG family protein